MWSSTGRFGGSERGVSEILGVVMLLGIVLGGALMVVVMGSGAITDVEEQNQMAGARGAIQEIDAQFGSFGRSTDNVTVAFDLGNVKPGSVRVVRRGSIAVTANDDPDCHASIPLSSIRYESDGGRTIAYQAGGVWWAGDQGGSVMRSAPDVTFQNGTLSVSVVDLDGDVASSRTEARLNATRSEAVSRRLTDDLYGEDCRRPRNLTLSVESDFDVAWADYLRSETDRPVDRFENNDTVRLSLPSEVLPVRANDTRNKVVNLSESPTAGYMSHVEIGTDQITINKSVGNTYTVTASPLYRQLEVGEVRNVETTRNVRRRPLDAVFVMDESGSMGFGSPTKLSEAKDAARGFVADLDSTVDRVGVVGYTLEGGSGDDLTTLYTTDDGEYLSNNFGSTGVNGSIAALSPQEGTNINSGIETANELYDYFSDQNRDRVAILLTDGVNDHPDGAYATAQLNASTIDAAEAAARNDVTIYTIGFRAAGEQIADDLLEDVADITGGEYYEVSNGDELNDRFQSILETIQTEPRVVKTPITTRFSADAPHPPTIPGDTSDIARDDSGSETYLNVNDPTAPAIFGHSFRISGNETVNIGATEYDCEAWEGTSETVTSGGQTYQVARCSDLDETSGTSVPTTVYTDGEDVSSLLGSATSDWQTDVPNQLDPYLDGTTLDLKSNQAVVAYDFSDSADSENLLLVLYEVGLSEEDTRANVFDGRVYNVTLSG